MVVGGPVSRCVENRPEKLQMCNYHLMCTCVEMRKGVAAYVLPVGLLRLEQGAHRARQKVVIGPVRGWIVALFGFFHLTVDPSIVNCCIQLHKSRLLGAASPPESRKVRFNGLTQYDPLESDLLLCKIITRLPGNLQNHIFDALDMIAISEAGHRTVVAITGRSCWQSIVSQSSGSVVSQSAHSKVAIPSIQSNLRFLLR